MTSTNPGSERGPDAGWSHLVETFTAELRADARLRSSDTPEDYAQVARAWVEWCLARGVDPTEPDVVTTRRFVTAPHARTYQPVSAATHNRRRAALVRFLDWATAGHGPNPARAVRTRPVESPERRPILTPAEVEAMVATAESWPHRSPVRRRHAAVVRLLVDHGMRPSALTRARRDSYRPRHPGGPVLITRTKTSKDTVHHLTEDTNAALLAWLAVAPCRRRHAPLLCAANGDPISTGEIGRVVREVAARAGVAEADRVTPAALRATVAAHASAAGATLPEIRHLLGHAHVATTARYLDHVAPSPGAVNRIAEWRREEAARGQ